MIQLNITYQLISDTVTDEAGENVAVYGIAAVDQCGQTVESIPDIFFDADKAADFIQRCNTLQLELSQLYQVIDDILATSE